MTQGGNNRKLLTIGGSGKLGKYCIEKWITEEIVDKVWNFDLNKLQNNKVLNFTENILEENGYKFTNFSYKRRKTLKNNNICRL